MSVYEEYLKRKALNQRFGEGLERDILPYPDEAPPPPKPLNQRFGESLERDVMGEGMAPASRESYPPRQRVPVNVELDRATGPGAWWTKGYPSLRSEAVENEPIGGGRGYNTTYPATPPAGPPTVLPRWPR